MARLHLIRHGQAQFGSNDYDQLSPLGLRQATTLGQAIGHTFTDLYCGTLKRQQQTADALYASAAISEVQVVSWLNELDSQALLKQYASESEKQFTRDNFTEVFARLVTKWSQDEKCAFESFESFEGRIQAGLSDVSKQLLPSSRVAMVTSGGVIATVLRHILKLDTSQMLQLALQINNASVTEIEWIDNTWHLIRFNALPAFSNQPELITRL